MAIWALSVRFTCIWKTHWRYLFVFRGSYVDQRNVNSSTARDQSSDCQPINGFMGLPVKRPMSQTTPVLDGLQWSHFMNESKETVRVQYNGILPKILAPFLRNSRCALHKQPREFVHKQIAVNRRTSAEMTKEQDIWVWFYLLVLHLFPPFMEIVFECWNKGYFFTYGLDIKE